MKTKTLIRFKSDVFAAVAVVDGKTPSCFYLRVWVGDHVDKVVKYKATIISQKR